MEAHATNAQLLKIVGLSNGMPFKLTSLTMTNGRYALMAACMVVSITIFPNALRSICCKLLLL